MVTPLSPTTITAAALLMQFSLCVIMGIGAFLIHRKEKQSTRFYDDPASISKQLWVIGTLAVVTLGALFISNGFSPMWKDLAGSNSIAFWNWSNAICFDFLADIACATWIIVQTGGSHTSAFAPIYFVLPPFAFFLRESTDRILIYTALVAVAFTIALNFSVEDNQQDRKLPFWAVSMLCLLLSLGLGFLTRPR